MESEAEVITKVTETEAELYVEVEPELMTTTQFPVANIVITPVLELTVQTELLTVEYVTEPFPELVFVDGVMVPFKVKVEVFDPG